MLNVYLDRADVPKDTKIIEDVELQFMLCSLEMSSEEQQMLEFIEHGTLNSEVDFIDRFGYKLYIDNLSTGCKAALCVLHFPDKIIDLKECGNNAVEAILRLCKNGSIIVNSSPAGFSETESKASVEIVCNGYIFTNYTSFNKYVKDWYPFPPDLGMGGIQKC